MPVFPKKPTCEVIINEKGDACGQTGAKPYRVVGPLGSVTVNACDYCRVAMMDKHRNWMFVPIPVKEAASAARV